MKRTQFYYSYINELIFYTITNILSVYTYYSINVNLSSGNISLFFLNIKEGLGLKTRSFIPQGVFEMSIISWGFQYPVVPGVDIAKPVWLSGFCPAFPGYLTSSYGIILCFLLGCSLLTYYECQDFSGSPIL
jgi:hypothetical protein